MAIYYRKTIIPSNGIIREKGKYHEAHLYQRGLPKTQFDSHTTRVECCAILCETMDHIASSINEARSAASDILDYVFKK